MTAEFSYAIRAVVHGHDQEIAKFFSRKEALDCVKEAKKNGTARKNERVVALEGNGRFCMIKTLAHLLK